MQTEIIQFCFYKTLLRQAKLLQQYTEDSGRNIERGLFLIQGVTGGTDQTSGGCSLC